MPGQTPATPWWKRTWVIALASLVVGITLGTAASSDDTTAAQSEPAPTITETVTAEPEPAPTVTMTITADPEPEPEPVDEPADAASIDGTSARFHCGDAIEAAIRWERPNSKIRVHTIAGVLAQDYRPDTDDWFIKLEVTVDGTRLNAECTVGGTELNPDVEVQAIY